MITSFVVRLIYLKDELLSSQQRYRLWEYERIQTPTYVDSSNYLCFVQILTYSIKLESL